MIASNPTWCSTEDWPVVHRADELGRQRYDAVRPKPKRVAAIDSDALIISTSAFFGPWDRSNFLFATIERLKRGEDVVVCDKTIVSPTYVPDLVHATLALLLDDEKGIWHLTNQGAVSWHDLARAVAGMAQVGQDRVRMAENAEPTDTSLSSSRGLLLRPLDRALGDFLEHTETLC